MSDISDIRDLFNFPVAKARPEHPDFWRMSEIILGLDAAMDERGDDEDFADVISQQAAKVGDSYSIVYMATQRALASDYGIAQTTVWQIVTGRTWKETPDGDT